MSSPGWVPRGEGRVGVRGGHPGFTKLNGNFKGDMHEVPGYPLHEERGRLGVDPRPHHPTPPLRVPSPSPGRRVSGEGVRAGNARSK